MAKAPTPAPSRTLTENFAKTRRHRVRDDVERWCDRHNHKMGMIRTVLGMITAGLQVIAIYLLMRG